MIYYFELDGKRTTGRDLRTVVKKAEEAAAGGGVMAVELYCEHEDGTDWMIDIPTKNPSDQPYLTKDWILCYERGCRFISRKNRNEPFCGKEHNPRELLEMRTTPVWCPVGFPPVKNKEIKIK